MTHANTSSRIIPVERRNIFVFLTVAFCLVNTLPRDPFYIWADVGMLAIYVAFFVLVYLHAKRKAKLPRWLAASADDMLVRLRDNRADLLTIVGCIALTVLKALVVQTTYVQIAALLLVTFTFWLSARTRRGGPRRRGADTRTLVQKLFGTSKKALAMPTAPPPPPVNIADADEEEDDSDVADSGLDTVIREGGEGDSSVVDFDELSDRERAIRIWEERQKERWSEWIEQEVMRLNEDRDD